ncbi:MAG: hypothetical protein ACI8ZM_002050 [Crocinitomix sp.]|jgi:hypothetical protein
MHRIKRLSFFIFISLILFSCSNAQNRINSIEEELNITLPAAYEIIQNDYYPKDMDYTFVIKLQLNAAGTDTLIDQIKPLPYFDQLGAFITGGGSLSLMGDEVDFYHLVEDSIAKTPYRGSWTSTAVGYEFIGFRDKKSNVEAWINEADNTLKFRYISF